jgi:hypothetical protein
VKVEQEHEYALIGGINRAWIGRYLAILAAALSSWLVLLLLSAVDLAHRWGLSVNVPPAAFSLVGAGAIFTLLYWIFNRYAWRWGRLRALLKVPDLSGEWECAGKSLNVDGTLKFPWKGSVTILQTWDKLRIRLKTEQSGSNSIAAALIYDAIDGYVLLYHYRNDPNVSEPQLRSHHGFASLTFDKKCKSAKGEYFTGHTRSSFGTMRLQRN